MSNPFDELLTELKEIKQTLNILNTSPTPSVEIIDRKTLQQKLNITEPTAIRMGQTGQIPEIRIGSNVRYNWGAVVEALQKSGKSIKRR